MQQDTFELAQNDYLLVCWLDQDEKVLTIIC